MKNKKLVRFLKWIVILASLYWILTTLIFGHTNLNYKTGVVSFRWSGLDALFSEDEYFGFSINEQYKTNLKGLDGPYIFDDVKFNVNQESKLVKSKFDRTKPIKVDVNNDDKDKFEVTLKSTYIEEVEYYDMPKKLIAISDIEGNYNAFYGFLLNNKVINEHYEWIFGDGHLVLNGDFFDRGINVNQVLWLIYKLEIDAEKKGGKVHFINGNHETMNLYGDISYSNMRYIEVAKQISKEPHWSEAARFLYSEKSELGKWLRTKNIIEKIGKYIFVHGGLNKKIIDAGLNISELNKIAKTYYGQKIGSKKLNYKEKLVVTSQSSPYWDRSLASNLILKSLFFFNGSKLEETSQEELELILSFYDVEKIVIGHSVVSNVKTDYNRKVIKIDVKHGAKKNSRKTQGLLIENGVEYRVDGLGKKEKL